MEVYPSRTQLPELLPQPVLAGVIGGICFLSVAVIFSTMAACIMNRRRAARIQKRRQGRSWLARCSHLDPGAPGELKAACAGWQDPVPGRGQASLGLGGSPGAVVVLSGCHCLLITLSCSLYDPLVFS